MKIYKIIKSVINKIKLLFKMNQSENPTDHEIPFYGSAVELKSKASPLSYKVAAVYLTTCIRFYKWTPGDTTAEDGDDYIGTSYSVTGRWVKYCETARIIQHTEQSIDFGTIAANSHAVATVTVQGAATADGVVVNPSLELDNGILIAYAWVSATNTVKIKLYNATGAGIAIDEPFDIVVIKTLN